ncbi:hypothetical protein BDY17DRAFT_310198 [Neohortaea acidophila]|uniref:DUF7702 domain-containing protein n=1 Tax=Neohortaea acidophila TaxID=245834 RepID=A0A6A6PV58_9PEZI|nr:uncharacterized protein BDY17DRAFT_310198 [Neohortaea acidophila]KAF2483137.1 hypothetical protein BDY17DRAFT_310198 [Neohortaea acidophila]
MGVLNPKGGLAAAELAFFAPAFCVAAYVVFRQGLSRQLGWIYLNMLSLLRLIGASCLIYAEVHSDYSDGLLETAAITGAIGTAPLLLVLMGFLERVHAHMLERKGVNHFLFKALHYGSLGALVLAIVGGVNISSTDDLASSGYKTGKACMEAASILFLSFYLTLAGITIYTQSRVQYVVPEERKLIIAGLAALPLLMVRILYTVLVSFDINSDFFFRSVNVYVEAFMQFTMEALVVIFFIIAGLLTPRVEKTSKHAANTYVAPSIGEVECEAKSPVNVQSRPYDREMPEQHEKPEFNLFDYRPSKLIRTAIAKHI